LHRRMMVILRANAHGSHVLVVTSRWCRMSMERLKGRVDPYIQRYRQTIREYRGSKFK
jgi:hypothetical protein